MHLVTRRRNACWYCLSFVGRQSSLAPKGLAGLGKKKCIYFERRCVFVFPVSVAVIFRAQKPIGFGFSLKN